MDLNYAALHKGENILLSLKKVGDETRYQNKPLVIVGPGPSFDLVPKEYYFTSTIFALNAAITETWKADDVIWVSNDYDRTWENKKIKTGVLAGIEGYSPWRLIVNRKFVPGQFGDIRWLSHHDRWEDPMKWRLPIPTDSEGWWYTQNPDDEGYLDNGESVLELALEVATAWNMNPIVLIGVDYALVNKRRTEAILNPVRKTNYDYYAKPWQWKEMPPRMFRGKMNQMRGNIIKRRKNWPKEICTVSRYWTGAPFSYIHPDQIQKCLVKRT